MSITLGEGEIKVLNVSLMPTPVVPASLSGVVVDADTGFPIAGVAVEIVGLVSTTTASDGSYSIINIPPGSYTIRFAHPDYEAIEY